MTTNTSLQVELEGNSPFANVYVFNGTLVGFQALNSPSDTSGKYELRVDLDSQNEEDVNALRDAVNRVAEAAVEKYTKVHPGFTPDQIVNNYVCIKIDKDTALPLLFAKTSDVETYRLFDVDSKEYTGPGVFKGSVVNAAIKLYASVYKNDNGELCINVGAKPHHVKVLTRANNSEALKAREAEALSISRLDSMFASAEATAKDDF